ncbi:MAG: hypothetical protein ACYTG5_16775, partial [Planctomycetota bacterium]
MTQQDKDRQSLAGEPTGNWSAAETRDSLIRLRQFHLGLSEEEAAGVPDGALPALLESCRERSVFRAEYPLLLSGALSQYGGAQPVSDYLDENLSSQARFLGDNLLRLERQLQFVIASEEYGDIEPAERMLQKAGEGLQEELKLSSASAEQLAEELAALISGLPADAKVLRYGRTAPLRLMIEQTLRQRSERDAALRQEIQEQCRGLQKLLEIERGKDSESRDPQNLERELGSSGGELVDSQSLARVIGEHRGAELMDRVRRARIAATLATMQSFLGKTARPGVILVYREADPEITAIAAGFEGEVELCAVRDPLAKLPTVLDRQALAMGDLFLALRVAQL